MMSSKTSFVLLSIIIFAACSSRKSAVPAPTPTPTPVVASTTPGWKHVPGNEELTAIQGQFQDATLEELIQGHTLYMEGACVKCHNAKNIYRFSQERWRGIVNDMAVKAKISDTEREAVYRYVISIKGTEVK